jgi:hypothetical protein
MNQFSFENKCVCIFCASSHIPAFTAVQ